MQISKIVPKSTSVPELDLSCLNKYEVESSTQHSPPDKYPFDPTKNLEKSCETIPPLDPKAKLNISSVGTSCHRFHRIAKHEIHISNSITERCSPFCLKASTSSNTLISSLWLLSLTNPKLSSLCKTHQIEFESLQTKWSLFFDTMTLKRNATETIKLNPTIQVQ